MIEMALRSHQYLFGVRKSGVQHGGKTDKGERKVENWQKWWLAISKYEACIPTLWTYSRLPGCLPDTCCRSQVELHPNLWSSTKQLKFWKIVQYKFLSGRNMNLPLFSWKMLVKQKIQPFLSNILRARNILGCFHPTKWRNMSINLFCATKLPENDESREEIEI